MDVGLDAEAAGARAGEELVARLGVGLREMARCAGLSGRATGRRRRPRSCPTLGRRAGVAHRINAAAPAGRRAAPKAGRTPSGAATAGSEGASFRKPRFGHANPERSAERDQLVVE